MRIFRNVETRIVLLLDVAGPGLLALAHELAVHQINIQDASHYVDASEMLVVDKSQMVEC